MRARKHARRKQERSAQGQARMEEHNHDGAAQGKAKEGRAGHRCGTGGQQRPRAESRRKGEVDGRGTRAHARQAQADKDKTQGPGDGTNRGRGGVARHTAGAMAGWRSGARATITNNKTEQQHKCTTTPHPNPHTHAHTRAAHHRSHPRGRVDPPEARPPLGLLRRSPQRRPRRLHLVVPAVQNRLGAAE